MLQARSIGIMALVLLAGVTLAGMATAKETFLVNSQAVCGERIDFVERLKDTYFEKPISSGLSFNGSLVEVFASEKGSFTILVTQPDGASCLILNGLEWQAFKGHKI